MFDNATLSEAFSRPGIDPRQWISFGTVEPETSDAKSVFFKDDKGQPNPVGPLVIVKLHPSGIIAPCRVAAFVAGNQEGEWYPFVGGDEVIVAIPEGDERAGCTIIGRLNNEIDTWPATVAGMDATKNKFGYRRLRAPYVIETGESYLVRSVKTGAQFGIDGAGQVFLNDSNQGKLFITADVLGFESGDSQLQLQIQPGNSRIMMRASSSLFAMTSSVSKLFTTGVFQVGTAGTEGNGHAVTAEQVVALIINVIGGLAFKGALNGPLRSALFLPIGPVTYAPTTAAAQILLIMQDAIAGLGDVKPISLAGFGAGSFAEFVGTIFGPTGAISTALGHKLAPLDKTFSIPGYGRPGFLI